MNPIFNQIMERSTKNGALAIFANLLFDTIFIGWLVFASLYLIETVLPTFIIARLSLVKFCILLIALTMLLASLREKLPLSTKNIFSEKYNTLLLSLALVFSLVTIVLTHYRFPWWSIPLSISGYALSCWLFFRPTKENA